MSVMRQEGHLHRGEELQSHAQDPHGSGGIRRQRCVLAAGDGSGRLPFGIAQIGKAFRNEITPGQFVFRTREFEQMEMEFFCRPEEADDWFKYWIEERKRWYVDLGMREENLQFREHEADELSHYSAGTFDVDYRFPWGFDELEGIANRTDFDLKAHMERSGKDLTYFDQESGERFVPYVIEPAAGATRTTFAFLLDAYAEIPGQSCDSTSGWRRSRSQFFRYRRSQSWSKYRPPWPLICVRCGRSNTMSRRQLAVATGAKTRSVPRCVSPSTSIRSTTIR